ncbi:MAG: hypothetical protein LQ342_000063 [Letrouitia transgressa]|nr:MAG: hypothetical protein LQ342_000063 [Letrouitia transgressa]
MPLAMSPSAVSVKPTVLFLGDNVIHNHDIYDRLSTQFHIIQPPPADLDRPAFLRHLEKKTWGEFQAIMRPSWHTGGEMGQWDRELIELLPDEVKVYASAGAGYDWVDVSCLAEHGILYCNGAGASSEAVGDMALYHIISVFRNMTWSFLSARSGDPKAFAHAHHHSPTTAHNPRNHSLGIMGLGNIGYIIAQKAYAAFGMRILYHDIVRKVPEREQEVNARFFDAVEEMLPQTDCLLLATPSTFNGRPLVTDRILALLPRGARFVNIARGSLVDEDALIQALQTGQLSAAGLDVHAREPHVDPRLAGMSNVTLTCHTGGGVVETRVQFERLAMENVEAVLTGRQALTPVNGHLIRSNESEQDHETTTSWANGYVSNGVAAP